MGIKIDGVNYCKRILVTILLTTVFGLNAGLYCTQVYAKEPILIIRAEEKAFEDSEKGLSDEIEGELSIRTMVIKEDTTEKSIETKIKTVSPKIVVLMDNKSISLYKKYQSGRTGPPYIPSVSIMGLFMDSAIKGLKNATGIYYEIPVVTSIINLRNVLDVPLEKVGIIHREFMKNFIIRNREYCLKEDVDLISYEISRKNYKSGLKKGLTFLTKKKKVDAIWVVTDSKLITSDMLQSVWFPFAKKFKKPIIVGVEMLANPKFNFGTFAVVPDHTSLGMQAAEIVLDAMENDWSVEKRAIAPPRSVYQIINLEQAKRLFKVKDDKLKDVDKIAR